jgi:hypothetical protein
MALMLGKLYDALRQAGASEDAAREASEEVAAFDRRLPRIEILVAANPAVLGVLVPRIAGILWLVWETDQAVQALRSGLGG